MWFEKNKNKAQNSRSNGEETTEIEQKNIDILKRKIVLLI